MQERIRCRLATVALMLPGPVACGSDSVGPPELSQIDTIGSSARDLRLRGNATLRQLATRRGIRVGAAVGSLLFRNGDDLGAQFRTVLSREFSVVTPEGEMKHGRLQPSRGVFTFSRADSLVAFAEANAMQVRGHTLVWHYTNASWLTSGNWTREEARALLTDHVRTVVEHYQGRIFAWDVVNEALSDDGTLRSTIWSNLIGPDYIELAFRTAHAADPQALLFYNDYNIEDINPKSDSAYTLIQRLLDTGVPIHGVGFQGHFEVGRLPSRESVVANIARFATLGLKVHFTEVDIRMPQPSTRADLRTQAENYRAVFDICLQNVSCQMVVTWGVSDRASWIPGAYPGWGEALLFDRSFQPKPAYWMVYNRLAGG